MCAPQELLFMGFNSLCHFREPFLPFYPISPFIQPETRHPDTELQEAGTVLLNCSCWGSP